MELIRQIMGRVQIIKNGLIILILLPLMLVTSCSSEPIKLGAPNVKFYVLDLTGSGDVDSQFNRIAPELNRSITEGPFGNPFGEGEEIQAPETSIFSFIGTNSRFLESFELVDLGNVYSLFDKVSKDNRRKENWAKLKEYYQDYIKKSINSSNSAPSESDCMAYYDEALSSLFNSQNTRDDYAQSLCEIAVSSLSLLDRVKTYIDVQKNQQRASDVFGALQVVETEVNQKLDEYPEAKISVVLATDGDHTYGKNQEDNLRNRIENASDICNLANEVATELNLQTIRSKKIELKAEGLGALKSGAGRYPAQLDSFWRCFFNE